MSTKSCCLCFTQSCEFTSLQNELGESNKAYEITVTYFDPMLLTGEENSQLVSENTVLCQACWSHIEDFHEFQQTVKASRSQLEKNRLCTVKVKREEELATLCPEGKDIGGDILLDDLLLNNENEDEQPLTELMTSENIEDNLTYRKNEKIESNLKEQEIPQCGKSEGFQSTNNCISSDTPKNIARMTYCREIGKESDYFISQWKAQLECDLCQELYPNFETLRNHFREKHEIKCYIKCCERKFFYRCVLVDHIKKHINPAIHKCDICDKIFAYHSSVELHKRVIHDEPSKLECTVCHKFFKLKSTLNHHLLEHIGIKTPKFSCDICGTQLMTKLSLKRHMAAYHNDGTTLYVCSICGKVSASKYALLSHKKLVHEGKRKYKCSFCDKAFKAAKAQREHIATHTGQDLYQCAHCPQTFRVNSNLHLHRKKVHPKEWEEARRGRLQIPKVNIKEVKNQVVL